MELNSKVAKAIEDFKQLVDAALEAKASAERAYEETIRTGKIFLELDSELTKDREAWAKWRKARAESTSANAFYESASKQWCNLRQRVYTDYAALQRRIREEHISFYDPVQF